MGDAFSRWDGFSYYGTFADFLPSAALAAILWFLVSVFFALLLSFTGDALKKLPGWNITTHHYQLFTVFFIISGIASWFVKRKILHLGITIQITLIEIVVALTIAVFATWLLRSKARQWIDVIQDRITPLVWLYGIMVILSVPLVAYHAWGKHPDKIQTENLTSPSTAAEKKPNIVLVTFDALTARHMSVYGYHRQTTPFIDEWAKKASVFTRLKAAGTFTALTTASLMTGKRAWTHNVFQLHSFNTLKSDIESIPVLLKKNGYYTMAFTPSRYSSEIVTSIGRNGFDFAPPFHEFFSSNSLHGHLDALLSKLFYGKIRLYNWVIQGDFITGELLVLTTRYRNVSVTERRPEKVFNKFLSHTQESPQKPYFAWIHIHPPHAPYLPPEPYMGKINPSSELRRSLDQYNVYLMVDTYNKGETPLDEIKPKIDALRDRYDEFIMYCDKQFEDFINKLQAMNESGNTIVILSSDHGEMFTPSQAGHGGIPKEPETHIPFIIRESEQNKKNIINDLVEQTDIPATILGLADIPVPEWMEGRSLVPLTRNQTLPEQPVFSVNFQGIPGGEMISKGTVAVWEGNYKLIHDLGKKTSELFNLKNDPDEQNNVIDKETATGQHLLSLIMDEINKANQAFNKRQPVQ